MKIPKIVRAIGFIGGLAVVSTLVLIGKEIPGELLAIVGTMVGYYFGIESTPNDE